MGHSISASEKTYSARRTSSLNLILKAALRYCNRVDLFEFRLRPGSHWWMRGRSLHCELFLRAEEDGHHVVSRNVERPPGG